MDAIFSKDEANLIKMIPLSTCNKPDKLTWRYTNTGLFTIKSAFHLYGGLWDCPKGQSSDLHTKNTKWTQIWHLKIPNGNKTFLWNACLDALPTRANMFKRNVVDNPERPFCKQGPNTVEYALWECTLARHVWGQCTTKIQKCGTQS